jgi:hypothetical protein
MIMAVFLTDKGLDQLITELREFSRLGPRIASGALDGALDRTAALSRSLVHSSADPRHAGALRLSERHTSQGYPGGWAGQVSYGEPDQADPTGSAKSIGAARAELQRGGEHSQFIDGLSAASAAWMEAALGDWWDRTLGR